MNNLSMKLTQQTAGPGGRNFVGSLRTLFMRNYGILLPVIAVSIATIFVPRFYSANNISSILVNMSILAIVGLGGTVVIAARGLDLSVGSNLAWSACVFTITAQSQGLFVGVVAGLLAGAIAGLINGVLVVEFGIPSFVATLGAMGVLRGASLLITGGSPVTVPSGGLEAVATGSIAGVPFLFLVCLGCLAIAWLMFNRTPWGKHVRAFGGQPEAAIDSGVNLRKTLISVFLTSGLCAAIGGILLGSQLGVVDGTIGTGFELKVIAIVVLGGTSLLGGRGNMFGTVLAALLLAQISSGLNLMNVKDFYQYLATGVLLVAALALDTARTRMMGRKQK